MVYADSEHTHGCLWVMVIILVLAGGATYTTLQYFEGRLREIELRLDIKPKQRLPLPGDEE